jgi:hypothetical protein
MVQWNFDLVVGGMPVGGSFFVPCIHCNKLIGHVRKVGNDYGVVLRFSVRFEMNIKGIRVWRIE